MRAIKMGRVSLSIVGMLILVGCQSGIVPSAELPPPSEAARIINEAKIDPEEGHLAGQVQISLSDKGDLSGLVQDMSNQGIRLSALSKISGREIYLMRYEASVSIGEVVKTLRADGRVKAAAPNYPIQIQNFDPDYALQWSFENRGQDAPGALAGKVSADMAFDATAAQGSNKIVVAVVDTGIDYLHEDLSITEEINGTLQVVGGNMWMNPHEIPGNGLNDDNNSSTEVESFVDDVFGYNFVEMNGDPMDDHGHGTHIAGVIGALRNNFIGIKGMNAEVKMMAVRFLGANGGGSDWGAQQAVYYVVDMAKRFPDHRFIMNCSWGSSGRDAKDDGNDFILEAFRKADEANIFSAIAAGNDSLSTEFSEFYPANYSVKLASIVSVAATNNNDQLADFSNYGHRSVQVAAPGVLIHSTLPGNQYEAWSGTSMAAPHVAGLAALVWARDLSFSALEVKEQILLTVDKLPQLTGLVSSGGRINVSRALANDWNVGLNPVKEELAVTVTSQALVGDVDHVTTLEDEGAKTISVCFERLELPGSGDWLQVYGSDYRVRDIIQGMHRNKNVYTDERMPVCTAPVPGSEIHLRLSTLSGTRKSSARFVTESVQVTR